MRKLFISLLAFVMVVTCAPIDAFALAPTTMGEKPVDGVTFDQPFAPGTGTSQKFRIPAIATLENGTVIAGIDARWNTYLDGGGLDTIVSTSKDNGDTWYYTYPNYLGDNGNIHNGSSSCFIDPAFAVDGNRVYMMVDLWPGGYALNGANHSPIAGQNGFDENGNLRLTDVLQNNSSSVQYNYHLVKKEDGTVEDYYAIVKNSDNSVVEGYTIDAYFNLKSENDDTNLFYWNSPFKVYPTNYLWVNHSDDEGKTWSIPTLANVKFANEQTFLVAPGTGLVVDLPDGTKRIMYTGYEFTSGDKNSWVIYSDDGGETWNRGAKCSGWSSESTITQVGEKIYIFTRHGVCYYISDDYGETFSAPISSGIDYNSNCMIHAITYSKKIDGKDAIILSAPSNTGSRSNGKLFVGLVEEDGTIDWKYNFVVDNKANNQYYAYSCLTELKDGRIGLLYENIDAGAKYVIYTIDEITGGAMVGDYWLENGGAGVNKLIVNTEPVELTIKGLTDENVTVLVDNKELIKAEVNGDKLTISNPNNKLGETYLTLTIGEQTLKVKVTAVSDSVQGFEYITLNKGESKEFFNTTGNFMDATFEGLDTNIATMEALSAEGEVFEAQLGTNASFDGEKIALEDCLMTFTGTGTSNVFKVTADVDGVTYYLGTRGAKSSGYPVSTIETTITVEKQGENKFSLKDNSTANNNGCYLYFWKDAKLRYDRNGTLAGENTSFYILEKAAKAEGQIIEGYNIVTTVEAGKQYLIVNNDNNGNHYVLHPSSSTSNHYDQLAKVLVPFESEFGTKLRVTGVNEGTTAIEVGNIAYFINVVAKKQTITLGVGESMYVAGDVKGNLDTSIAKTETSKEIVAGPYVKADGKITTGKYLIGNDTHLAAHEITKDTWAQTGLKLQAADFETGSYANALWTVTEVDGGYTIQAENGKYVGFADKAGSSASIVLTDTPQVLTITNKGTESYDVTYVLGGSKFFFNNFGGVTTNKLIAGYTDNSANWRFYKPTSTTTTLTGIKAGTTSATIGSVEYNINIVDGADYTRVDNALKLVEEKGNLRQYTKETVAILNEALNAVQRDLPYAKQNEVNQMAANIILAVNQLVIDENAVLEADKEALKAKLEECYGIEAGNYTDETFVPFIEAYSNAEVVYHNEEATQEEVDEALAALVAAFAALEEKPAAPSINGWEKVDGKWYFYVDGVAQTGWVKDAGKWYFMDTEGAMQTGWVKDNNKWYYLNTHMMTGWQQIDGQWYYLNSHMITGWLNDGGKWYFLDSAMKTGWVKDNGKWYFLDSEMKTGWIQDGGKWYYMNSHMMSGWQQVNGTWYYLNNSMVTGWLKVGDIWYYFTEKGAMVTGTVTINGKVQKFNSNGAWLG